MTRCYRYALCALAVLLCSLGTIRAQAMAPSSASLQLPNILPQGLDLGNYTAATTNNKIFLQPPVGTSQRSLCNIGPSVWCQSELNQRICGVYNTTIGVCGYGTTVGNCTVMTMQQFCANSTLKPLAFNGGINAAPQGNLGLLVLALYWAPTSCQANSSAGGGFCSTYTQAGYPAATKLSLHGMWPDTGSLYTGSDPLPPLYTGAYQGWTQYCSGVDGNFGQCGVSTGNLCTWPNATQANFSQSNYESCMRANNVTACQVEEATVTALRPLFERYAPGYLGDDRTFLDHEFFKHASCIGGQLTRNKTAFFERAVGWAANLTAMGSPAADLVQNNVGKNITIASLLTALGRQGNPQCTISATGLCKLSEIWYCLGVDAAGYPTSLIDCPSGSQLGTCDANKCANSTVLITSYDSTSPTSASAGK